MLGRSPFDDPNGLSAHLIPIANGVYDIGAPELQIRNIYATSIIGALEVLDNNTFLQAENAAGTGQLDLVKANASDNTVVNAKTGKVIDFSINDVAIGIQSATSLTEPAYLLSDGSDKNHSVTTYGSGTGYTVTNTSAAVVMGTSSPSLVLDKAGTYLITARLNLEYVGATFAANRTVTLKLYRTNNTPADITGSSTALGTNIVTTVSGVMASVTLPPVVVTTTNTNDIIVPYADVSVAPSAGSLQVTEGAIVAIRLY